MSFRTLHFSGTTVKSIIIKNNRAEIHLAKAVIIKNMDGAEEDTQWEGFGALTIKDLIICDDDDLPNFPCLIATADLKDNQMTYRDEVLIPIDCNGNVGISIHFKGEAKARKFMGEYMQFDVGEHEKYICHVKH